LPDLGAQLSTGRKPVAQALRYTEGVTEDNCSLLLESPVGRVTIPVLSPTCLKGSVENAHFIGQLAVECVV
jgi:hypothetical protein